VVVAVTAEADIVEAAVTALLPEAAVVAAQVAAALVREAAGIGSEISEAGQQQVESFFP